MSEPLKLFVWENVLGDYFPGIMFALAPDVETAKKLILEKGDDFLSYDEFTSEPRVIDNPEGFYCYGGD